MNFYGKIALTNLGELWIAVSGKRLVRVGLNEKKEKFLKCLPKNIAWKEAGKVELSEAQKSLSAFLNGKKLPLSVLELNQGTEFQKAVWKTMHTIPHGETRSYAWIAEQIGKPKAFRAVANACGRNPLPIVIPCHRVIASDGSLGGFSSGIEWKKKLHKIEKISCKD